MAWSGLKARADRSEHRQAAGAIGQGLMRGLPYAVGLTFSSASWVSASRSQNLARLSHAHLSSLSLQLFAL